MSKKLFCLVFAMLCVFITACGGGGGGGGNGGSGGDVKELPSLDKVEWKSSTYGSFTGIDIAYGNGTFVIVGYGNSAIAYSDDAISWTKANSPTSGLVSIEYGNGYFVAIDSAGEVIRSRDGINWESTTGFGGYELGSLAYGNGIFIATDYNMANVYVSKDSGKTWTYLNATGAYIINFAKDRFFSGGGLMKYSLDSSSWVEVEQGTDYVSDKFIYGDDMYITVGLLWQSEYELHAAYRTSTDGISWTAAKTYPKRLTDIIYTNGQLIAIDEDDTILYSLDGPAEEAWIEISQPLDAGNLISMAHGNGVLVVLGDEGVLYTE